MIIKSVNLENVCGITSVLPQHTLPELALAGKSNVGKSTLINTLTNRKNYAHTSGKPGKTQTVNYYRVNDAFYFVDLPGYGYTRAGIEVKEKWGVMIEHYLHKSEALRGVFLLVDIRHEPSQDDILMFDWVVQSGFSPFVIATKADKIKRSQLAGALAGIRKAFQQGSRAGREVSFEILPFSSLSRQGKEDILIRTQTLLEPDTVSADTGRPSSEFKV